MPRGGGRDADVDRPDDVRVVLRPEARRRERRKPLNLVELWGSMSPYGQEDI